MSLSGVVKIFLEKFVDEDVLKVQMQHDVEWEKIFDQGVRSYFMSKNGKENTRIINELLRDIK